MEEGTTICIADPGHFTHMGNNLWQLYQGRQLCDVTLMSTDGMTIRAHWVVLCATSEYFRSMMNCIRIDAQVILLDAPSDILIPIIEYIYTGKIQVALHNYQTFINVAKFQKLLRLADLLEARLSPPIQIQSSRTVKQEPLVSMVTESDNQTRTYFDLSHHDTPRSGSGSKCSAMDRKLKESSIDCCSPEAEALDIRYYNLSQNEAANCEDIKGLQTGSVIDKEVISTKSSANIKTVSKSQTVKKPKTFCRSAKLYQPVKSSERVALKLVRWYKHVQIRKHARSSSRKVYLCRKCNHIFTSRGLWRKHHMLTSCYNKIARASKSVGTEEDDQDGKGKFPNLINFEFLHCPECDEMYEKWYELQKHLAHYHNYTKEQISSFILVMFKCDVDGCTFTGGNVKSLMSHMAWVHPNVRYSCSQCYMEFRVKHSLKRHMKLFHRDRKRYLHSCSSCDKTFMTILDKEAHEKIEHGVDNPIEIHKCSLGGCNYQSRSRARLREHMTSHSVNKPLSCSYCSRTYKTKPGLKKHVKEIHISTPVFLCQVCGLSVRSKHSLEHHTRSQHGNAEKYTCQFCIFETLSRRSLADHTYHKHRVKASFDTREILHCDQCPDYSTVNTSRMRKHINSAHSEVRNSVCDECPKSFKTNWELRLHKQMHAVSKSFQCPECEFSCKFRGSLDKHIKLQHWFRDYKPYVCVYCNFGSNMMAKVRSHVRHCHRGKEVKVKTDYEVKSKMKKIMLERKKMEKTEDSD